MIKKNHVSAILFSVFLGIFGGDRFYLGCYGTGSLKLIVFLLGYILSSFVKDKNLHGRLLNDTAWFIFIVLAILLLLAVPIWWLVDLINIAKRKKICSGFIWDDEVPKNTTPMMTY